MVSQGSLSLFKFGAHGTDGANAQFGVSIYRVPTTMAIEVNATCVKAVTAKRFDRNWLTTQQH